MSVFTKIIPYIGIFVIVGCNFTNNSPGKDSASLASSENTVRTSKEACAAEIVGTPLSEVLQENLVLNAITASLPEKLIFNLEFPDSIDSLNVDAFGSSVPLMYINNRVVAAASSLGKGRIIALGGANFLAETEDLSLLETAEIQNFLVNSVSWVSRKQANKSDSIIIAENIAIKNMLKINGFKKVGLVPVDNEDAPTWSRFSIKEFDAVIVLINEFSTRRFFESDIQAIRDFVSEGGGLIVAGSATNWNWWISENEVFLGNKLLEGTGIKWNFDPLKDFFNAGFYRDSSKSPKNIWKSYIESQPLSDDLLQYIPGIIENAINKGLTCQVDAALKRLIADAPAFPVSIHNIQAKLMEEIASKISPYNWPKPHPWSEVLPGSVVSKPNINNEFVPAIAEQVDNQVAVDKVLRIEQNVNINMKSAKCQHIGLFAAAGEIVEVSIDPKFIKEKMQVSVGDPYGDLAGLQKFEYWLRPPNGLERVYELSNSKIKVGNVFGGSICISGSKIENYSGEDTASINVKHAIAQPMYVHGKTHLKDWYTKEFKKQAPMTLLVDPDKITISVPSSAIRRDTNPLSIMSFWRTFYDSHLELNGGPAVQNFRSLFVFDKQVGWGYAYAQSDRMVFPMHSIEWALRRDIEKQDLWLFGHELGHQFQTKNWTGSTDEYNPATDITEIAVNLYTMYTLNKFAGGSDFETRGFKYIVDHAEYKKFNWLNNDYSDSKLRMYQELIVSFGWTKIKEVFKSYYLDSFPEEEFGEHLDGFAIRLSYVVKKDLTAFFANWKYPLSEKALRKIKSFNFPSWLPPGW